MREIRKHVIVLTILGFGCYFFFTSLLPLIRQEGHEVRLSYSIGNIRKDNWNILQKANTEDRHIHSKHCCRKGESNDLENGFRKQLSPELLELIKSKWIKHGRGGPLKIKQPMKTHFSQHSQSEVLDEILVRKTSKY